jgi:CRISPR-associated protein Csd1
VAAAYGIERENSSESNDSEPQKKKNPLFQLTINEKVRGLQFQRLLDCKINGGLFPVDIMQSLVEQVSKPQNYSDEVWREILWISCAVIQKYHFDRKNGGDVMEWELAKVDRSFQFGRLLAVMERAEELYYLQATKEGETARQTNAIRRLQEYRKRPMMVAAQINEQLEQAYLPRIKKKGRDAYKKASGEIFEILSNFTESELNKPLNEFYLLGYSLQRNSYFGENKANKASETDKKEVTEESSGGK